MKFRKCLSSPDVTLSYAFKSMTPVQQLTYHDLGNFADDDGFVDNPTVAMMMNGADAADLSELAARGYLIAFDDGIVLVNHWKVANSIRRDRYKPSLYHARLAGMNMEPGQPYRPDSFAEIGPLPAVTTNCQPDDNHLTTNCQPLVTPKTIQDKDKTSTNVSPHNGTSSVISEIVEKPDPRGADVRAVVSYLNAQTGKHFRADSRQTAAAVRARLSEGFTVDDFRRVIDAKVSDWAGDPQMERYLRPSTLFRPSNFEAYANQGSSLAPAWHGRTFDYEEVVAGGDAG